MQKGYFYNVLHVQYSFCFLWRFTYRCFCNHFYKAKTKRHVTQRMSVSVLVESLEFFMEFTSSTKTNFETVCILTETENQRITKLHLHE